MSSSQRPPGSRSVLADCKRDFPILSCDGDGQPLVYLDSASSSQHPAAVIDAMSQYYETTHANVSRGVYSLAEQATNAYEGARAAVARFIGAPSVQEVIFTKNVTESINLVAQSWGGANLREGDTVLVTEMEHHANLVPWLMLKEQLGIEVRHLEIDQSGELELDGLERALDGVTLVAVTSVSNVLGTINPIATICEAAHAAGALILVDAAQHAPHMRIDVAALGVDFLAFTGHKMLGPTGIGVLWAREELLTDMRPFMGGGAMISDVTLEGFTPNVTPWKFEAGTPPIAEAVGLEAAIDYLQGLGLEAIRDHEVRLTRYALTALEDALGDRLTVYGPPEADQRAGLISFSLDGVHPHDVADVLDRGRVCVRAGHHCAKPLMRRLGIAATTRASFYVYNDEADVDQLVTGLRSIVELFS
jgi:cysteine desulfurase/selenocysteine lyase